MSKEKETTDDVVDIEAPSLEMAQPLLDTKQVAMATTTPVAAAATRKEGEEGNTTHVRLIAPSDLPKGYRLPVKYRNAGDQTVSGYIHIPESGVQEGQTFQADICTPKPITGRWSHDIFNCNTPSDGGGFCCLSFFCAPVAWACLWESVLKRPSGSCWIPIVILFIISNALYFVQLSYGAKNADVGDVPADEAVVKNLYYLLSIVLCRFLCLSRGRFRRKYNIPGNAREDCLCTYFCGCCTAMQAYKHASFSRDHPRLGTETEYPATIVV